jgi:iron uptake system EfeUOB component EfeO/EfeM
MSNSHGLKGIAQRLSLAALIALPMWLGGGNGGVAQADPVVSPIEQYRAYLIEEISQTLISAKRLRERAAAHDVEGAKKAWIASRVGWEKAEVFISGFVSDLDENIDAWPNALNGFHAIEARLFGANSADVGGATDQLIYHLTDLDVKIRQIALNSQGLLNGAARLAYEVGESKADGGESRYSGTSLDDMRNNVSGIQLVYKTIFASPLEASDPKLAQNTEYTLQHLASLLGASDAKSLEPSKVRTASEELIVALQDAAPKIGLRKPTLEDITQ